MNELSLFTGAVGGLLGTHLLGWTPIGYVEYDDYCQRLIAARIADGILREAPIFGDIRAFISEGYADAYSGLVDVVTAGFPCQPFSVAGQRKGADDDRNMWPQTIDVIRRVRPRVAYLENVPGLLAHPYARRIFGDLAESGYDCRWRRLSAAETGAPHRRDRWWCVAYASSDELWIEPKPERRRDSTAEPKHDGSEGSVANTAQIQQGRKEQWTKRQRIGSGSESVSNASSQGLEGQQLQGRTGKAHAAACGSRWWEFEPDVGRVAHGVASRVDRLRALGNGQVPAVVRAAWNLLTSEM